MAQSPHTLSRRHTASRDECARLTFFIVHTYINFESIFIDLDKDIRKLQLKLREQIYQPILQFFGILLEVRHICQHIQLV